jgi:hypothetical protein
LEIFFLHELQQIIAGAGGWLLLSTTMLVFSFIKVKMLSDTLTGDTKASTPSSDLIHKS